MPLVFGAGIAYSPLFYRNRRFWPSIYRLMIGSVPQPASATEESPQRLDEFGNTIEAVLDRIARSIEASHIDSLIVLTADRSRYFNDANVPQLHVFAGNEIWGDASIAALGETAARTTIRCDRDTAELICEELVSVGFEVAESRDEFRPLGDPEHGAGQSLVEATYRIAPGLPAIPIHINCHTSPAISGRRVHAFGSELARALRFTSKRIGIIASGGLSGDPYGTMAGWIDATLDRWVLRRLATGRSVEVARVFEVDSHSLRGSAAEMKLWVGAAAAMEEQGARAEILEYLPLHHAAVGAGFAIWEARP